MSKGFYEKYWQREGGAIPENDPTTEERKTLLTNALRSLSKGAKVLDAGCGSGEFAEFLKQLEFKVAGVDISQTAIKKASMRCPETNFCVKSLEDPIPFKDAEFDAIWSTEVLEHIFDVHSALSEINRVLKDSGLFILTVPYHGIMKNIFLTLFGFERHFNPELSHIRFFTNRSLTSCLTNAGFKPVFWKGIGRFYPLYKGIFVVAKKVGRPEAGKANVGYAEYDKFK